nr:serine hydrolase [uncultured Desulfobulbus sp.]
MEIQLNKKLSDLVRQGLVDEVFCGISAGVSVGHKGQRFRSLISGGKTRFDGEAREVTTATLFDLASLTKPLATVLCTLSLIDQGKLDWLDTVDTFFSGAWPGVRLEDLLHHCSGLPAYRPYYRQFPPVLSLAAKNRLLDMILAEHLEYATGTTSVYSDLGFIVLGRIVERCAAMSLDQFFQQEIAEPLGIADTLCFLPINGARREGADIAATENCPWRQAVIQGEVHDENCWLMGGVAGHAGLFGTVEAVLSLCELLLDVWKGYAAHPAFSRALLYHALSHKQAHSGWCLGFDTPSPGGSSSGRYFSPASVGHLGFSGTSFWIDPEKEVVVVLLTNRVHPTRENVKIRTYRPWFHDQLMEIICR